MTDFDETKLRHYCRYPKCRSRLLTPVSNERDAFCTRGCHGSFYRHRCRVCERPIEQPAHGTRLICKRSTCRNAWNVGAGFGRFAADSINGSSPAKAASKTPDFIEPNRPLKTDRPWRIIAGRQSSASALHCATVLDDGGEYQRIDARNQALLRDHFRQRAAKCLIQPHHPPVSVLGGYRFPGAPMVNLAPLAAPTKSVAISDTLDIPAFLLRRPPLTVLTTDKPQRHFNGHAAYSDCTDIPAAA